MDNPQVTATEIAWLAGIWDGEGTISVRYAKKSETQVYNTFSPRVSVVNTNPAIIRRVCETLDKLGLGHYVSEKGRGAFEGSTRQCWIVQVERLATAARLLMYLEPYLVGKVEQAKLLRRFLDSRILRRAQVKRNSDAPYSPEELELIARVVDLNGNQRGTSETIREDAARRSG